MMIQVSGAFRADATLIREVVADIDKCGFDVDCVRWLSLGDRIYLSASVSGPDGSASAMRLAWDDVTRRFSVQGTASTTPRGVVAESLHAKLVGGWRRRPGQESPLCAVARIIGIEWGLELSCVSARVADDAKGDRRLKLALVAHASPNDGVTRALWCLREWCDANAFQFQDRKSVV